MNATQKRSGWGSWILWWMVDPKELDRQVTGYSSLPLLKRTRVVSSLFIILSVAITLLFILFKLTNAYSIFDSVVALSLLPFVYFGQRWSLIAVMIYWTLEKGYGIFTETTQGQPTQIISSLIWWTAYMHSFYLSLRVETARRSASKAAKAAEVF